MINFKRTWMVAAAACLAVAGMLLAQGSGAKDLPPSEGTADLAAGKSIEVTVKGENICLGCALKKEKGAGAQCSIYGHKHVLRVSSATAAGEELTAMNGWVLHYLETQTSEDLIKNHHGESLTIIGKVYPNERVLEVASAK